MEPMRLQFTDNGQFECPGESKLNANLWLHEMSGFWSKDQKECFFKRIFLKNEMVSFETYVEGMKLVDGEKIESEQGK